MRIGEAGLGYDPSYADKLQGFPLFLRFRPFLCKIRYQQQFSPYRKSGIHFRLP